MTIDPTHAQFLPPDEPTVPRDIVLTISAPPSVNRTRKVDWRGNKKLKAWHAMADLEIMAAGGRSWVKLGMIRVPVMDCFALHIEVPEQGCDLDNLKAIADYLKRIELVTDDARRNMRELHVVVVKDVPAGMVRVRLQPISGG